MSKELLVRFLAASAILAEMTTTTVDDELVQLLQFVAENTEVYNWVMGMLDSHKKATLHFAPGMDETHEMVTPSVRRKLGASGIKFGKLIQYLPKILEILRILGEGK